MGWHFAINGKDVTEAIVSAIEQEAGPVNLEDLSAQVVGSTVTWTLPAGQLMKSGAVMFWSGLKALFLSPRDGEAKLDLPQTTVWDRAHFKEPEATGVDSK